MKFLTFACLLLVTPAVAQQQDAARPDGSIYGVAIASDGQPAKRVGLTAVPLGVVLGTVLPHTATDDRGEYRFVHLPWSSRSFWAVAYSFPFSLSHWRLDSTGPTACHTGTKTKTHLSFCGSVFSLALRRQSSALGCYSEGHALGNDRIAYRRLAKYRRYAHRQVNERY